MAFQRGMPAQEGGLPAAVPDSECAVRMLAARHATATAATALAQAVLVSLSLCSLALFVRQCFKRPATETVTVTEADHAENRLGDSQV